MKHHWFALSPKEIFKVLQTQVEGLTQAEAERRLRQYGRNALPESRSETLATVFLRQYRSPLIYVLLLASAAIFLLGDTTDALVILFVLFFNSLIGTLQEGRAQRTLQALKQLTKTSSVVLRDGEERSLPDDQLVPGDIILLTEGQRIAADARVIEAHNLTVDESTLTGEAVPSHKVVDWVAEKEATESLSAVPLGDQKTVVFKGTLIATGRGKALVVATGQVSEIGKIAQSVETISTEIPLKRTIEKLTHQIVWVVGAISLGLLLVGLLTGYDLREIFKIVVALAVSAIPEGLPIVLTLVLSTGVWRMSKRNALIKKLAAVEALGQATVIAVDKTGTITENELMVTEVYAAGELYEVKGEGYSPEGSIWHKGEKLAASLPRPLHFAATVACLNATAQIAQDKKSKTWQVTGDPTEAALLVLALKLGVTHAALLDQGRIVEEFPFDYERKYRAAVYEHKAQRLLAVTGAPEIVIEQSKLSKREQEVIGEQMHGLFQSGRRVIAFAYREAVGTVAIDKLPELTFGGLIAMQDTLKPDVLETVKQIQRAGIRIVMITGDHHLAAQSIAKEAGIFHPGDKVMTGAELSLMEPEEIAGRLKPVTVFARVAPEDKQKIVEAYRLRGDIIAMTGDGVNDAPSLVAADLGLAMGRRGTEVAKEASDIILLDDNLKSIVAAIEEGRNIYKTLRKVITYLFSTSAGEILVVGTSIVAGLSLPITAAQIIWLNLVTDGFLDVSLAMEPKDKGLMKESWSKTEKRLIDSLMLKRIALFAVVMALGTLAVFKLYDGAEPLKVSSMVLTVMAAFQWFNAWNSRTHIRSVFSLNPLSNGYLVAATITIVLLQVAVLTVPFLQSIFHTQPLLLTEWVLVIVIASTALWAEELRKVMSRLLSRVA